jgi:glycogen synthase
VVRVCAQSAGTSAAACCCLLLPADGYAWECQTQEGGWGLDAVVRENNWKLRGIVNGIDYKEWSPENDVHLTGDGYCQYDVDTLEQGKKQCKVGCTRHRRPPQLSCLRRQAGLVHGMSARNCCKGQPCSHACCSK